MKYIHEQPCVCRCGKKFEVHLHDDGIAIDAWRFSWVCECGFSSAFDVCQTDAIATSGDDEVGE